MSRTRIALPSETRGFQQVALGVTEEDVGLTPLGEEGLRSSLRQVPFEWAFAWTARLDAEIRHGQMRRRASSAQLEAVAAAFHEHPNRQSLLELVATEERELFNTLYLHALQRLLVLEAAGGVEEGPGDMRRMQDAFLGVCNFATPASGQRGFDPSHYVALMVRSGAGSTTESIFEAITRAYAIYYELPRRSDASAVPNYRPPEEWEPDARRTVSVHERFMVGMAIMGSVGVGSEALPPPERPTGAPPGYFDKLAEELEGGDSRRLERAIAGDRAFFRRMFERESPTLRSAATNSVPFQVRPLLAQAKGGYLLSSTNALASWMTRGVHYACLTPIEGTPAAQAFLTYVGRLFELYGRELLENAHATQREVRVIGEQIYDRGASLTSDVAILDGGELVLIELEAHRFTKDALLSGDDDQVLSELDTMIVSKARQLDDCITALRRAESPAELPRVDMKDIDRIWPVVVIEGGIVQNALLGKHLEHQLDGALQQQGVQPLCVMTMNELEAAAGFVEHGHRFAMLLHRWKFGFGKHVDFTYYCFKTPGLERRRRSKLVDARWKRLNDEVALAFSEETQAQLRAGNP